MVNERISYTVASAEVKTLLHQGGYPKGPLGELHLHPELEFILVRSGSLVFRVEGASFFLHEGDVFALNSRVPHYGELLTEDASFGMVQFSVPHEEQSVSTRFRRFLATESWRSLYFAAEDGAAVFLREQMLRLLLTPYRHNETRVCRAMSCKYELLGFLYENGYLAEDADHLSADGAGEVLQMLSFLEEHYAEEVSLDILAAHVHLSKNYVCRLFKRVTGHTAVDCLNFVRVSEAEKLLRAGKSVTETAAAVGFNCPAYFGKVFRKYLFFSPSEYCRRIAPVEEAR